MTIRILHTADWQIGKPFSNVPGDSGAALRAQRIDTIRSIANLAVAEEADAILVAGDVFDDNAVSDETLRRTINAMEGFTGPWVLLPGNHDAGLTQSAWSRLRKLGIFDDNIIIADKPEPISLLSNKLAVLPAPLMRRQEVRDLTEWFDNCSTDTDFVRVGLAHGSVTNRLPEAADTHNPISEFRTKTAKLDYLALGDWHGTLDIADKTWYSGTHEQDRFRQNQPGNVLIVDIAGPGQTPSVRVLPVGRYHWHQLELEITDEDSIGLLVHALDQLEEPQNALVRLRLTGAVTLSVGQQLNELMDAWLARLHFLEVNDESLAAQPSEDDIADIGATGFMKEAISKLIEIENNKSEEDSQYASRALQILYLTKKEMER